MAKTLNNEKKRADRPGSYARSYGKINFLPPSTPIITFSGCEINQVVINQEESSKSNTSEKTNFTKLMRAIEMTIKLLTILSLVIKGLEFFGIPK